MSAHMNRLGIEALSALGLGPVDYVNLAADLGCAHVSIALTQCPINPWNLPPFDLAADKPLRREMAAAMRDRGVSGSLGEGMVLAPGRDLASMAEASFEAMLELGISRLNMVSMDPDLARTHDQFAMLAERATAAGFADLVCEFAPVLTIRNLAMALDVVAHIGRPNVRILLDTMHFGRSGGTAADLAAIDPDLIGYVQLADAPLQSDMDYMQEAMIERKAPGEGAYPLADFLARVPRDRVVSLEIPQLGKAMAGQSALEILQPAVAAARALLEGLPD